jgi:hypothetical protein
MFIDRRRTMKCDIISSSSNDAVTLNGTGLWRANVLASRQLASRCPLNTKSPPLSASSSSVPKAAGAVSTLIILIVIARFEASPFSNSSTVFLAQPSIAALMRAHSSSSTLKDPRDKAGCSCAITIILSAKLFPQKPLLGADAREDRRDHEGGEEHANA